MEDVIVQRVIKEVELPLVWDMRHRIMYPQQDPVEVRLPDDSDALHLGYYDGGRLMSVISLFERNDSLQFRKFATENEYQRRGYGSQLLAHVMEYARTRKVNNVWCNARLSATAFYRKFGMTETGQPWTAHGIEFIKMEKKLN